MAMKVGAYVAAGLGALALGSPAEAQRLTQVESSMLSAHNRHRTAVGAPGLVWDATLAANARRYSAQMAQGGRLVHSAPAQRVGQGENIAYGSASTYTPAALINAWAAEKRFFKPGIFPNVSTTGNWASVAHYTQIIWPTTTKVGCGVTLSRGINWLVCRYAPPGNVVGKRLP